MRIMKNCLSSILVTAALLIGMPSVSTAAINPDGKISRDNNPTLVGANNLLNVNKDIHETVTGDVSGNNQKQTSGNNLPNSGYRNIGSDIDCVCDSAFAVGDSVVALVDSPSGAVGIMAGDTGTVFCGSNGSPPLLVVWDNWENGHGNTGGCDCGSGPGSPGEPTDNGWWVLCDEIEADGGGSSDIDCVCDSAFAVGDIVVALVDSPSGAVGIMAGDTGTVFCGSNGSPPLLVVWDNWENGHDNTGACDCGSGPGSPGEPTDNGWWVQCDEIEADGGGSSDIDCVCDSAFAVGDIVVALVDSPSGAVGIMAGDTGTVFCGSNGSPPLLVVWDNWENGHDNTGGCDCGSGPGSPGEPTDNGWWVQCDEIEADGGGSSDIDCVCDSAFAVGDIVVALVDSPSGAVGIMAGDTGTVFCGSNGSPPLLVVWDNWENGHDNTGGCDCGSGPGSPGEPTDNGWWVQCDEIEADGGEPCVEDINGDGIVNVTDLLQLIGAWGACP